VHALVCKNLNPGQPFISALSLSAQPLRVIELHNVVALHSSQVFRIHQVIIRFIIIIIISSSSSSSSSSIQQQVYQRARISELRSYISFFMGSPPDTSFFLSACLWERPFRKRRNDSRSDFFNDFLLDIGLSSAFAISATERNFKDESLHCGRAFLDGLRRRHISDIGIRNIFLELLLDNVVVVFHSPR